MKYAEKNFFIASVFLGFAGLVLMLAVKELWAAYAGVALPLGDKYFFATSNMITKMSTMVRKTPMLVKIKFIIAKFSFLY